MDFANHPCFNAEARHKTGRIHLPVAPKCNVQCNFLQPQIRLREREPARSHELRAQTRAG